MQSFTLINFILGKPLLRQGPEQNILYDPWSGKEYCSFMSPKSFEKKHKEQLDAEKKFIVEVEEQQKQLEVEEEESSTSEDLKHTPIYFDPTTGFYYYPEEAVAENYQVLRKLIKEKPKIVKTDGKKFMIQDQKEGFVKVGSYGEFAKLRKIEKEKKLNKRVTKIEEKKLGLSRNESKQTIKNLRYDDVTKELIVFH